MKKYTALLVLAIVSMCFSLLWAQIPEKIGKYISGSNQPITNEEATSAIREALLKGTEQAVSLVSAEDGYFGNPEIHIPFPPDAKDVEKKLRSIGMGSQVDEAILSFNRAAEKAAQDIQPVFFDAVKNMSVREAMDIVNGDEHAATEYLRNETYSGLVEKIEPIIEEALADVGATRYWTELIIAYNALPFVRKINPDLTEYVTGMAIDGLFVMIAREEEKIRENPAARTSELLEKVFGR